MWQSLFSRDITKDFGYEIQDQVFNDRNICIWKISEGKRKAGSCDKVSVFSVDEKDNSADELVTAREYCRRLRTLRHPNLLTFVDSLESEKLVYLVTEWIRPLIKYLADYSSENKDLNQLVSWGLFQVSSGLKFLNDDCKLIHNNIGVHSVFVNHAGDWKLGGLEYSLASSGSTPGNRVSKPYDLTKYDPPELSNDGRDTHTGTSWSIDSWGLGCLIYEIFNGTLSNQAGLRNLRKIPVSLEASYGRLIEKSAGKRISPESFIDLNRKTSGFMKNPFVDTLLFLDEIQIKEPREKTHFFQKLNQTSDIFPKDIAKNKILPQLVNAYEYGNAGSAVLAPMFKLGKLLDEEDYQKKIVPCIVKLFSSNDRATRVKLLEQVDSFAPHLSGPVLDKIFPNLATGFMDSNPVLRESTVKAMLHVAPKLNYNNLNVELMKHFARLQSRDDQPGIRTNTTVCLGKVAPYLHPQCRQKILISAFTRSFKDDFPPARTAGIMALTATQHYYTISEIARKVIPALATMTVDPEKTVRGQAFKALRGFLDKVEKASDNPELIPKLEEHVNSGGSSGILSAASVPSWAQWAFGSVSKFYKTSSPPPPLSDAQANAAATTSQTKAESPPYQSTTITNKIDSSSLSARKEREDGETANETDGWDENDEDWGSMEDGSPDVVPQSMGSDGWNDDEEDWGSLEVGFDEPKASSPPNRAQDQSKQFSGAGDLENSFLPTNSKKPSIPASQEVGGWDDEGWDEDLTTKSFSNVSQRKTNEERRKEIDERRKQRQQAGPLKLGSRKIT